MSAAPEHFSPKSLSDQSVFHRSKPVSASTLVIPNPKAKLLEQVREVLRVKHYALRTEEVYILWIKRCIFFHQKRHPREMGAPEVQAFLSDLAVNQNVSASTQNQALNALVFFITKSSINLSIGWINSSAPNAPLASRSS